MLVLTRKAGQRTMIDLPGGGTITVTLIRLEGPGGSTWHVRP